MSPPGRSTSIPFTVGSPARREAMDARGSEAWTPSIECERKVSSALKAYAPLAASADKRAVRDLTKLD